jgi:transposase
MNIDLFIISQVIFSDETYFDVANVVRSQFVRRKANGRITAAHTTSRRAYLQRLLFWGCFSGDGGPGSLVFVDGTMKTANYIHTLQHHLLPFMYYHQEPADVIFQHDNAPCHKSHPTATFLEENNVQLLHWPPYSPDLSPIENLWGILKRRVHRQPLKTKEEVRAAVEDAWQHPSVLSVCQKLADYEQSNSCMSCC